jgi:hypothetical protein
MTEQSKPRRHHHRENRLRRFLQTYTFEIVLLLVVALAVFLLAERMNIRATLAGWLLIAARAALHWIGHLDDVIRGFIAGLTLSNAVGYVLLLGAVMAVLLRLRWWLMHSPKLTTIRCPQCNGDLRQVHRRLSERLVGWYVPLRRYRCYNRECRWQGVRIKTSTTSHRRSLPSGGELLFWAILLILFIVFITFQATIRLS